MICKCCGDILTLANMAVSWMAPLDLCSICEEYTEDCPVDPTKWDNYRGCNHKN